MATSIHLSHRQHRLHRASMFGVRHFHSLLSLQIRSMWQHQQQLRCLNPADHVQRVLQPSSCLHLQKLRPCRQTFFADDRKSRKNDQGKYLRVKSNRNIERSQPLWEQLAPVLKGGPDLSKSQAELRSIREKVPELTNVLFNGIFPADNVITAVQKNHGVHKIHMSEPAAWVINGTHWFSLLQ